MPTTENDAYFFDLARQIREKVEGAPGKRLLGSEIGRHINHITGPDKPNFPDGWRLSRFLNDYAPDLTIVGRQGADLLWGLSVPDDAPTIDISDLLPSLIEEENLSSSSVELKSCRLKNYRSLEDVELPLHNVTVLVGANAAGKSNLLDGLFRAVQLTHRKPKTVFSGRHDSSRITRRGATSPFELHVQGSDGWSYRFKGAKDKEPEGFSYSMGTKKWNTSPSLLLTSMSSAFGPAVYLQLNAHQLQRSTFSEEERPYLRHDGLYLASVLASIAGSNRGRLQSILERVRSVLPFVEDLRTPRKKLLLQALIIVWPKMVMRRPSWQLCRVSSTGASLAVRAVASAAAVS